MDELADKVKQNDRLVEITSNQQSKTKVKVSCIIPVYNAEVHLKKCLDSIVNQTFRDLEIILVNDCSSDNSKNICDDYVKKDNRIKLICNQLNLGASLSREVGLRSALGNFIQFIDSDDWIELDMIDEMVKKAETEKLDMVICDICQYSSDTFLKDDIVEQGKFMFIKNIATTFGVCAVWNKLVKKEIFKNVVFPATSFCEDRYITLQTVYFSEKIGRIPRQFYHYEYNTNSTTKSSEYETKNLFDLYDNYSLIIEFLKNNFKTNIELFEPELSVQMNDIKTKFIRNKTIRKGRNIFELYPESGFLFYLIKKAIKKFIYYVRR